MNTSKTSCSFQISHSTLCNSVVGSLAVAISSGLTIPSISQADVVPIRCSCTQYVYYIWEYPKKSYQYRLLVLIST